MSLEFIEDGHRYFLDEKEIPSVSEIIRFVAREVYKEADTFAMDQAADRGTRVHRATEEIDRTRRCECDSDIAGYVNAYTKFMSEHDVVWQIIEKPMVNTDFLFAGTIDRFGIVDGKETLLDIKTTKRISEKHKILYGVQLELYNWTDDLFSYEPDHVVLQLKDDGTYKLIQLEHQPMLAAACLNLHTALTKKKRKVKTNGRN